MGLFGGFKAKLVGHKEKKPRKSTQQVVCVKFNTFSEFDSYQNELPSSSGSSVRQPAVKPATKENGIRPVRVEAPLPPVTKSVKAQLPPVTASERTVDAPLLPVTKPVKAPLPPVNASERTRPVPVQAPLPPVSKSNGTKPVKVGAPLPPVEVKPPVQEPLPPLPREPPPREITVDSQQTSLAIDDMFSGSKQTDNDFYTAYASSDEDEDNFKIHFVDHTSKIYSTVSEDESEEESPVIFQKVSSQAASIFFGDESEEPTVVRPRNNYVMDDDNASEGSSASA